MQNFYAAQLTSSTWLSKSTLALQFSMSFGLIVEVWLQHILTIGYARECKPLVYSYSMALLRLFGYTDAQPGPHMVHNAVL
jgi:hypothetical protein